MLSSNSQMGISQTELSILIPVYNEEENIKPFLERVETVLGQMELKHEIIFMMDPSTDQTEIVIRNEIERNPNIKLIIFSRRFGQPAATMAGILSCKGKYCVVIDVDLQDPPELIRDLYEKANEGYEVVYAKRSSRKGETLLKKISTHLGYAVINKLSEVDIPRNAGDFRIMSRRVMEELRSLKETHGFLRGLVAFVGFKQTYIEYDRDERLIGKGNYNRYLGSIKIALNGIVSFSLRPLQMMTIFGFMIATFSFLLGAWYVLQKLLGFPLTPGLSTTVLVVSFFSGVQLICFGIMGEYIGRIYEEVRQRPMYIIEERVNFQDSHLE